MFKTYIRNFNILISTYLKILLDKKPIWVEIKCTYILLKSIIKMKQFYQA